MPSIAAAAMPSRIRTTLVEHRCFMAFAIFSSSDRCEITLSKETCRFAGSTEYQSGICPVTFGSTCCAVTYALFLQSQHGRGQRYDAVTEKDGSSSLPYAQAAPSRFLFTPKSRRRLACSSVKEVRRSCNQSFGAWKFCRCIGEVLCACVGHSHFWLAVIWPSYV